MQNSKLGTEVIFVGGNNDVDIGANAVIVRNRDVEGRPVNVLIDNGSKLTPTDPVYDGVSPDLRDWIMRVDAILLTHCHNDHFNGLNTLEMLGYKIPPVYGSLCTINSYKMHRRNFGFSEESAPEFRPIKAGEIINVGGSVEVEGFDTSHSSLGSMGFHILTKVDGVDNAGLIFTGDFNLREMQATYADGSKCGFDEAAYKDLISRKMTTHIFMDSTSTETPDAYIFDKEVCVESWVKLFETMKKDGHEQLFTTDIGGSGEHLIKKAEAIRRYNLKHNANKKMYIGSFNLAQTMEAARKAGFSDYADVIFYGRPNEFLRTVAPSDRIIDLSGAFADGEEEIPAAKSVGKSGVVRLSEQEKPVKGEMKSRTGHPFFEITPKDVFVQAQRDVGINSKGMRKVINRFAAMDVKVYQVKTYLESSFGSNYPMMRFQSSGHAGNTEAKKFYNYHPKTTHIVPTHGDKKQLGSTSKIAREEGFKSFVFENADTIKVAAGKTEFVTNEDIDKVSYLAFKQENSPNNMERTIFIHEANVYQDSENHDKEHIMFVNELGTHKLYKRQGHWMTKGKIEEERAKRPDRSITEADCDAYEKGNGSRKFNRKRVRENQRS